jgi:hypothetical protein
VKRAWLVLFLIAGCDGLQVSQHKQAVISDAVHSGGTAGFYFLPPLVPAPALEGSFDGAQSPVVTIEERDPKSLAVRRVVENFSGSEIRVDSGSYAVSWRTRDYDVDPLQLYRINVRVQKRVIGFADVDVVPSQAQVKKVDSGEYIPLVDGHVLIIKFWLGACAKVVCAPLDDCHEAGSCQPATGTCTHPVKPNGSGCSDGNACTVGDSCVFGVCSGRPLGCLPLDSCHAAGVCDPATGQCSDPVLPNGTACSDNNPCTIGDRCESGECLPAFVAKHIVRDVSQGKECAFTCEPTWDDCDGTRSNGCETRLSDNVLNCGACGKVCAADQVCVDGGCAPSQCDVHQSCGSGSWCEGPGTLCASGAQYYCGALWHDRQDCGHCGNRCDDGRVPLTVEEICVMGRCVCSDPYVSCPEPFADQGKSCVSLSDNPRHCGGCGVQCADGLACRGGKCCTPCGSNANCVDLESDVFNCGACGHACPNSDFACVSGQCQCAAGGVDCGGVCVIPQNNPDHCGGCNVRCSDSQICQGTSCVEKTCVSCGATSCNDLTSDRGNCGSCGHLCGADQICFNGVCRGCDGFPVCGNRCLFPGDACNE